MLAAKMKNATAYNKSISGFTLIEILVALVIFVILAVMSYGGLRTVLAAQESLDRNSDRLANVQFLFLMMGRDIEQAVPRRVRDNYGELQSPVLGGGGVLELSRGGWRNPAGLPRSDLLRIAYNVEEGSLLRQTWSVLDRAQDSEPVKRLMLDNVSEIEVRFLAVDNKWQNSWPPASDTKIVQLPRAIEVAVITEDWGKLARVFRNTAVKISPPKQVQP